jgi:hypothetical protein
MLPTITLFQSVVNPLVGAFPKYVSGEWKACHPEPSEGSRSYKAGDSLRPGSGQASLRSEQL